jgi:NAD(P)-dependent dehydrogenase (short-subunit alcohol dehydrogenase family)
MVNTGDFQPQFQATTLPDYDAIGAATAKGLAAAGVRVVLVARGATETESVAQAIRDTGGVAFALAADVGDPLAAPQIAGAAAALVGPLDLLVHNASTLGAAPLRPLTDTVPADLARVLAVNVTGPFLLTRAVVGGMVLRKRGLVVTVSSDAAVEPYPLWGAYGISKAALDHMARVWAAELAGTGVRFLTVDPGEMDTRMHAQALPLADRSHLASPADVAARLVDALQKADVTPSGARIGLQLAVQS